MECTLPDTQVHSSQTPLTQSQEITPQIFWGRLFSLKKSVNSIDLHENQFTFGRHPSNNLIATRNSFGKHLDEISKYHFLISKVNDVTKIQDLSTNGTYVNDYPIGKSKWRILENEDVISINNNNLKVFMFLTNHSIDSSIFPEEFRNKYRINSLLGSGASGRVFCVSQKKNNKRYAAKVVLKALTSHKKYFESEIRIMRSLNHPNILSLKYYFETTCAVYMVLDFMPGGDLFKRIRNCGKLSEDEAKYIFYQILLAVDYIHHQKISHRDLKLENILLASHQQYPLVKVCDFGLSKEMTRMKTCCGTPSYSAPELLTFKPYNELIDIWSMGVILYICLTGVQPFVETKFMSVRERVLRGDYSLSGECFTDISDDAKNMIKRMLTVNPIHRIKVEEIFIHSWMKNARMVYEFHSLSSLIRNERDDMDFSSDLPPAKIPRLEF